MRCCILVVGMHRSGTSATTRVLSLLGAALPRNIIGADLGNDAGHWEPRSLVEANDRIFVEAGSRWDDWRPLDLSSLPAGRLAHHEAEIGNLIDDEFGDAPLFVVKDPRIARLVPLYARLLHARGIAARYVLPLRDPVAVIASLNARDGMTAGFASLLWLRHSLDAELATRFAPRAFNSYDGLLTDWRKSVRKIGHDAGIVFPVKLSRAARAIECFLRTDLRHHQPEAGELVLRSDISAWVKDAYAALLALEKAPTDKSPCATLDRIGVELQRVVPDFHNALFAEMSARTTRLEVVTELVSKHEDRLSDVTRENAVPLAGLESLVRSMIDRSDRALAERDSGIAYRDERVAELEASLELAVRATDEERQKVARLDQEIAARDAEAAAMRTSLSWRITEPLRELVRFAGRLGSYRPSPIELVPLHQLQAEPQSGPFSEWTATGEDPQFAFNLPGGVPLQGGRYRLVVRLPDGSDPPESAVLYFNRGAGYNEKDSLRLHFTRPVRGKSIAEFSFAGNVRHVRFDPTNQPGKVTLGPVSLRRLSRLERSVRSLLGRGTPQGSYELWIAQYDEITRGDETRIRRDIAALANRPLFSIVMPTYNSPEAFLRAAIDSVRAQFYENWELCIADDLSTDPRVRKILDEYRARDNRIKVVYRRENGHISRATNSAFELAGGDWVVPFDHDDLLRPHALAEVAFEIARHPDAEIIYSDEDKLDATGNRYEPYFKPDFSPELFRSQNYLNHLTAHRAANIRAVGGWRPGFEGSQDYDLNLRIFERIDPSTIRHIPKILYHWRAVEGSTAAEGSAKDYAVIAGLRALEEHLGRTGLSATAEYLLDVPAYRVKFQVPEPQPLVSLIIPTRDHLDQLRPCISSIVEKTTYGNYEIVVVDNNSVEAETIAYLDRLAKTPNIRVVRYASPFNFSAINNFAVEEARGTIVGLVNNDIEVISPEWLTEMVSWAVQPEIGCVGAKLYYADDTIQHAGVIVGLGGVAGHSHKHFPRIHAGYFFRLKVVQNLSAVTGACLLVRKAIYQQVGGLNEQGLPIAFNDVDFCLKVMAAGYRNVWSPYAEMYHLESVSRGIEDNPEKVARFNREVAFMKETWGTHLRTDPFYSPNLTRDREDFSIPV